ncbi:hypothetical protein OsI_02536 [Oryza sativa Indica Group]|uniref:Uncharacterized protein n=1 Tax=Oryza sativa subsp. indica TaxID=39946 RepID=B8AAP7_ORYSI|nr:hypothetical protein OsI_02536 [Oryza sativa Indica Group]
MTPVAKVLTQMNTSDSGWIAGNMPPREGNAAPTAVPVRMQKMMMTLRCSACTLSRPIVSVAQSHSAATACAGK